MKIPLQRLWRAWFKVNVRTSLPRPSFQPRLMVLEERDMPGSLLSVAAALQAPAAPTQAQYSVLDPGAATPLGAASSVPAAVAGASPAIPAPVPSVAPVPPQLVSASVPA